MTPTVPPLDQRHRHVAQRPLVLLVVAFAIVAGMFVGGTGEASATTATSVVVDRYGTRLGATVQLDGSHRILIHLGDTRLPDGKADYVSGGMTTRVVDHYSTPNPTPSLYRTLTGLTPGKLYWLQVYAQEPNGSWTQVVRNRAESTKSRLVKVYWDRVQILNDGDPMGCGELTLKAQVDHNWGQQNHAMSPEFSGCDGQVVNMNWSAPWVTQNGSAISIQAAVQDDDTPWGQMCYSGWGGCGNYWSGSRTLSLPNENNDGYLKDFTLTLNGIPGITWYGRYSVVYN